MIFALKVVVWIELVMIAGWVLWHKAASREFRDMFQQRHLALILIIPVVCFLSPRLELIHLAAMLIVPIVARDRAEAVAVFIMCLFLFPELATNVSVGNLYLLALTIPMSLTFGLGLAFLLRPGPIARISKPILITVLTFAGLLIVSALRLEGLPFRPVVDTVIRVILPLVLTASMLTTVDSVRRAMGAMLFAGVCLSLLAIVETARNWPIYQEVYQIQDIPIVFSSSTQIRGGVMRAPTTFAESTSFAILLAMCVFILAWLDRLTRSSGWRVVLIALFLLAMLAAVSRGAFLGMASGFICSNLFMGRARRAIGIAVGSVGAFFLLQILSPFSQFLSGIFNTKSTSGEADFRVDLLYAGIEIVKNHPLTGMPITAVQDNLSFLKAGGMIDFVNTYLFFAMTGGIPGAFIFLALIIAPIGVIVSRRRKVIGRESAIIVAMGGKMLILFFFTSYFERNPYWLILAAAWASALVSARPATETASARPVRSGRAGSGLPSLT